MNLIIIHLIKIYSIISVQANLILSKHLNRTKNKKNNNYEGNQIDSSS